MSFKVDSSTKLSVEQGGNGADHNAPSGETAADGGPGGSGGGSGYVSPSGTAHSTQHTAHRTPQTNTASLGMAK